MIVTVVCALFLTLIRVFKADGREMTGGEFLPKATVLFVVPFFVAIVKQSKRGCLFATGLCAVLFGGLFAVTLVIGLGLGDTWIVYPPDVTWISWMWPIAFWMTGIAFLLLANTN
jgi:hypothetical protein